MNLSTPEIIISILILAIGLIGNIAFYLKNAGKPKQIKWSAIVYGASGILLLCSYYSPDVTSSIMVSAPLTIAYILILNKFFFDKLK